MKKKDRDIPVTNKDWLLLIRDLPPGCGWIAAVLLLAAAIKLLFFE